jgi:hypothetical protein
VIATGNRRFKEGYVGLTIKPYANLLHRSVCLILQVKLLPNNFFRLMKMGWLVAHDSAVALCCIATFINVKGSNMVAIRFLH